MIVLKTNKESYASNLTHFRVERGEVKSLGSLYIMAGGGKGVQVSVT